MTPEPFITTVELKQFALNAVGIVIVIILGFAVYRLVKRGLGSLHRHGSLVDPLYSVLQDMTRWLIVGVVVLLSLQQLGFPIGSFWATVSAILIAVAVGFVAVWSVLSNILCSIILMIVGPFRIGDEVEVIEPTGGTGLRGKVIDINLLFTSLQEITEEGKRDGVVQIPNNIFFQKTLRRRHGTRTEPLDQYMFREQEVKEPQGKVEVVEGA